MDKRHSEAIGLIVVLTVIVTAVGLYWSSGRPAVGPEAGYMPTVLFDSREQFYPVAYNFDGDNNPTNNAANYLAGIGDMTPTVYYRVTNYDAFTVYNYWLYYTKDSGIWPMGSTAHEHDLETFEVFVKGDKPVILAGSPHGGMFGWNLYEIKDRARQFVLMQELGKHGSGSYGEGNTLAGTDRLISEPYKIMTNGSGRVIRPENFVFKPVEEWMTLENVFFGWWPSGDNTYSQSPYQTGTTGQYNIGDMITSSGNGAGVVAPWAYFPSLGATCREEWSNPLYFISDDFRRLLE